MSGARFFYTLLLWMALPLILLRLFWRGLAQREYWRHSAERFGFFTQTSTSDVIWIHAVSVGETRAAEPLIRALETAYPDSKILLTCMTPTGRATGDELFGERVIQAYLPYDYSFAIKRLLAHFRPRMLHIMETEIWFNLLAICQQQNIPALLVNARLSEKSAKAYAQWKWVRSLAREALASLQHIVTQSETDAARLRSLGATRLTVAGNLKFDVGADQAQLAKAQYWRGFLGNRQVLLCASTREGEEALLLTAYKQMFNDLAKKSTLLIIVPRHPQRFNAVFDLIQQHGLRVQRRSTNKFSNRAFADCDIWLGDSMGEMFAYLALSDVAIIGGSFQPLGGQNLIEACALGKPAIIGPSTFNFADVTRLANEAGALRQVADADEAMRTAHQLLRDDAARMEMSAAGIVFAKSHQGATERTMKLIKICLSADKRR